MARKALSRLGRFFHELRRRRVFRVTLVYAAVGWLLVQVADVVTPALALPPRTVTVVVVLVLLAFPLVAVLAWAYDLTPGGVERTPPLDEGGTARAVAGAAGVHWPLGGARTGDRAPEEETALGAPGPAIPPGPSIAALPFVNVGRDEETEYFSDGITEELIVALSRVPGLRVAARTSSFAFKGRSVDVREIARLLGVRSVVEGSVRMHEGRIRISAQLVNADDGFQIWADRYDRALDDIFAVQEEIARAIVGAFRIRLSEDGERLVTPPVRDVDTYRLYLEGRFHWNRRTPDDLRLSVACFRRAIERDPQSAQAHAGLADAYSILLDYGVLSPAEALPAAEAAAERALALDPALAETVTSHALVRQFRWDWTGAEAGFKRALELNPDYSVARHRYALLLAWTGRHEEAEREITRAVAVDPLSAILGASACLLRYYARDHEGALEAGMRVLESDERFLAAHLFVALASVQLGDTARGIAHLESALTHAGGSSPPFLALLAWATARAGDDERARELGARLEAAAARGYVSGYYRALPALGRGEHSTALDHLEAALEEGAAHLVYLGVEPIWDPLRADPRFVAVLKGVGLERTVLPGG